MKLADFLSPARAVTPLSCATLADARDQLLDTLVASGAVGDIERLRNRVTEERGEDMVAFADHAFLMHYRTDTAQRLQVAISLQRGVQFSNMVGIHRAFQHQIAAQIEQVILKYLP